MNSRASDISVTQHHSGDGAEADGFLFRRLRPQADLPGICQLFETVFHQPMDPSYWRWKYAQAPAGGSFNVVVEHIATGRLVGHMGVIVVPGMRAGEVLRMGQVCDVMLHPDVRAGIGPNSIYQRMNNALRQLAHAPSQEPRAPLFMYGFPGLRPAKLGERIGVYRPLQICTEYHSATAPQSAWAVFWRRHSPWRLRAQALPASADAWSDALLDALWQRHCERLAAQPQGDAAPRITKNAAYLRWRYLVHPQQFPAGEGGAPRYTLWLLRRFGQDPIGWLVTREQPQPVVVDSCLPPGPAWASVALQALPPPGPAAAPAPGWISWLPHTQATAMQTPIHAVEVLGQPFHPHWPSPHFQPGDTDVF